MGNRITLFPKNLRQVLKLMLAWWRSQPIKSKLKGFRPIRELAQSTKLETCFSFAYLKHKIIQHNSIIEKTSNSPLRLSNNTLSKYGRSSSKIGITKSCLTCRRMSSQRPRVLARSTIHYLDSWIIWSHPTTTSNSNTRTSRKTWTITARHETWRYRGPSRSCRIAWGAPPTTVSTKSECTRVSWWWSKWRQRNRLLGNRRPRVRVAKTTESVLQIMRTRNRSGRSERWIIIVL